MTTSYKTHLLTGTSVIALTALLVASPMPAHAADLTASSGTTTATTTIAGATTADDAVTLSGTAAVTITASAADTAGTDGVDVTGATVAVTVSTAGTASITGGAGGAGTGGATGNPGAAGGIAVSLAGAGTSSIYETVTQGSTSAITGGAGGAGGSNTAGVGGAGGAGAVAVNANSTYSRTNVTAGSVVGGAGGAGGTTTNATSAGGAGGAGGIAVNMAAANERLTQSASTNITGGAGGAGGTGNTSGAGGAGGAGAKAISMTAGGTTTLAGTVTGGHGGAGGAGGGTTGNGGAGGVGGDGLTSTTTAGTITVSTGATVTGGVGGTGGTTTGGTAGAAGAGGAGMAITADTLTINGTVSGGAGGTSTGTTGAGGVGVSVADVGAANAATITVSSGTVTGGLSGDSATRAKAMNFSANTGTVNLTLTGATVGSASTPATIAIDLSASSATAGGDVLTLSGTNTINGNIDTSAGDAALNGTINLSTGTTTVAGNVGTTGAANYLTEVNITGTGTLSTSGDIFSTANEFTGDGGITLSLAGGGKTLYGAVTTDGGTTGKGTITLANTAGTDTLAGAIGTSTNYVKKIDLTGAAGTTSASSTVFAGTVEFSADNTFTQALVTGGSTITAVTTDTDSTGTLNSNNTSGTNTYGSLGTSTNLLKAFNVTAGTTGAATVSGNMYVDTVTLGNGNTLNLAGNAPGTIDGNADGRGTLNITSTSALTGEIGQIHDLLALTVASGGALTYSGNVAANTVTVASGGTMDAGASKSITGALVNGGTIDLNTYATAVSGQITGTSGTYRTTIGNTWAGTGHVVASNGSATTFTTAVTITPTVGSTTIADGEKVIIFDNTGLAGAALPGTVTVTPSGLITWTFTKAGGAEGNDRWDTAIDAGDYILTADVAAASSVAGVSTTSAPVVDALGDVATTANANLRAVVGAVQSLSTGTALNDAGQQLSPEANGASLGAALGATSQAIDLIGSHNDNIRLAQAGTTGFAAGDVMKGLGVWGQAFGGTNSQDRRENIDGYDSNTFGGMIGADTLVSKEVRLGLAGAYARTNVDDEGARSGSGQDVDSYIGTVYGTYAGAPWYVDGSLTYGYHDYDSTRKVNFGGLNQTAKGSFSGNQFGSRAEFGYPVKVDGITLTPFASMAYNALWQEGYTETGAAGANLRVGDADTDSIRSGLGAKFAATVGSSGGYTFKPNARAAWMHEFNDEAPDMTSTFTASGGTSFKTPGIKMATDAAIVGVGLDVMSNDSMKVSFKYDAELKDAFVGHTGLLQLRKEF